MTSVHPRWAFQTAVNGIFLHTSERFIMLSPASCKTWFVLVLLNYTSYHTCQNSSQVVKKARSETRLRVCKRCMAKILTTGQKRSSQNNQRICWDNLETAKTQPVVCCNFHHHPKIDIILHWPREGSQYAKGLNRIFETNPRHNPMIVQQTIVCALSCINYHCNWLLM